MFYMLASFLKGAILLPKSIRTIHKILKFRQCTWSAKAADLFVELQSEPNMCAIRVNDEKCAFVLL